MFTLIKIVNDPNLNQQYKNILNKRLNIRESLDYYIYYLISTYIHNPTQNMAFIDVEMIQIVGESGEIETAQLSLLSIHYRTNQPCQRNCKIFSWMDFTHNFLHNSKNPSTRAIFEQKLRLTFTSRKKDKNHLSNTVTYTFSKLLMHTRYFQDY